LKEGLFYIVQENASELDSKVVHGELRIRIISSSVLNTNEKIYLALRFIPYNMSDSFNKLSSVGEMVRLLCELEGKEVMLRFDGPIEIPESKYNGSTYETGISDKATLESKVNMAIVEDEGHTLICSAFVGADEMERVGVDPSDVYTEDIDGRECTYIKLHTERKWWLDEYQDLSQEDKREAVENGNEDEVLPPWDDDIRVTIEVDRTERCLEMDYNSGFNNRQYSPPDCIIGDLIDVHTHS